MSGKGNEIGSDLVLKKRGMRCERGDWISELPDEIITHILSFLPLKEAVATSVLSSRWSNSWKYIPNLNFENDECLDSTPKDVILERSLKNAERVNSVLNLYKALSVKQFTLSFHMHPNTFHHLSKWLHFAFSRRVESLKLDFYHARPLLDIHMLSGIQSSDFRFLRELTLDYLQVSGEAIEFLLSSCSVLERLIMNVNLTSDVVIGGTLKYLEIDPEEINGGFIKVSAPNLTRLLECSYDHDLLLLENVPNLVEASFALYEYETMLHFAEAAAKLELLTISVVQPEAFAFPPLPKLKKLVVDYAFVNEDYMLPITCLLEASPCLEQFKLEISDIDHKYYCRVSSICDPIFEVPEHGGFPHNHLKVFEFVGFCDKAADHVELVSYIGNNCVGLEEIVITPMSTSVALRRQFELNDSEDMETRSLSEEVDVVAEEREALEMKKSTEEVLAGKLPDGSKLLVN